MAKQCYFEQMEKSNGPDFLNLLKPDQIQNASKKIVREMVKGDINYQTYGKYFLEPKFLDNLIIAVSNELETVSLYYNAVSLYKTCYPDYPNISMYVSHLYILMYIYNTILIRLNTIKNTGNISCLIDVTAILFQYRTHLN